MGEWTTESGAAGTAILDQAGNHVGVYEVVEMINGLARENARLREACERARAALGDNRMSQTHGGNGIAEAYWRSVDDHLRIALSPPAEENADGC